MKNIHKKIQIIKATSGAVIKSQENPYYKSRYFDINTLLEHLQPLFEEQGVLCLQPIMGNHVITKLIDIETGEEEISAIELPKLDDPQKMGSAVTYYRRYTLQSLLGLQAEDDDGNRAAGIVAKKETEWLTEEQFKKALHGTPAQIQTVLKVYNGSKGLSMKKEYKEALQNILKGVK